MGRRLTGRLPRGPPERDGQGESANSEWQERHPSIFLGTAEHAAPDEHSHDAADDDADEPGEEENDGDRRKQLVAEVVQLGQQDGQRGARDACCNACGRAASRRAAAAYGG